MRKPTWRVIALAVLCLASGKLANAQPAGYPDWVARQYCALQPVDNDFCLDRLSLEELNGERPPFLLGWHGNDRSFWRVSAPQPQLAQCEYVNPDRPTLSYNEPCWFTRVQDRVSDYGSAYMTRVFVKSGQTLNIVEAIGSFTDDWEARVNGFSAQKLRRHDQQCFVTDEGRELICVKPVGPLGTHADEMLECRFELNSGREIAGTCLVVRRCHPMPISGEWACDYSLNAPTGEVVNLSNNDEHWNIETEPAFGDGSGCLRGQDSGRVACFGTR